MFESRTIPIRKTKLNAYAAFPAPSFVLEGMPSHHSGAIAPRECEAVPGCLKCRSKEDDSLPSSFRGARRASYDAQLRIGESILPIVVMDSGLVLRTPRNDDTEKTSAMTESSKRELRRHRRPAVDRIGALLERGGEPRKRRVEHRAHQHRQHPALELIGDEEGDVAGVRLFRLEGPAVL
jgi:hypothetical protein